MTKQYTQVIEECTWQNCCVHFYLNKIPWPALQHHILTAACFFLLATSFGHSDLCQLHAFLTSFLNLAVFHILSGFLASATTTLHCKH